MSNDIASTLKKTKAEGTKLTMLVFGKGGRADRIYDEAGQAAENYATLAQVLRVPDPVALQGDFADIAKAAADGYDVVVLTLSGRIAAKLRGADALDFDRLDGAFVTATEG